MQKKCPNCGETMQYSLTEVRVSFLNRKWTITDFPVWECPKCRAIAFDQEECLEARDKFLKTANNRA